jgi:hypothetical protein
MSTASIGTHRDGVSESTPGRRLVTQVASLDELIGAHPESLRKIYGAGRPTDPAELGESPRGRVLAFDPLAELHVMTRPVLRALASGVLPWKGKVFDHGGNGGQNVIFGRKQLRFRTELGPSHVDGRPALLLRYDSDAFNNPKLLRPVVDELRTIANGVAVGPAFWTGSGAPRLLLWFGLEHPR